MRMGGTVAALVLAAATAAAGDRSHSVEYPVKAAFIYNFMRYVEWPAASGEMAVCVVGQDPFGPAIDAALAGKTVGARAVTLRRLPTAEGAASCAVVFVPATAMREWAKLRPRLRTEPVLSVGEARGFTEEGGVIGFVVESNRLQFEVNQDAATAAGLRLSSRLLSLAHSVRRSAN
jgi:hypothetical protein